LQQHKRGAAFLQPGTARQTTWSRLNQTFNFIETYLLTQSAAMSQMPGTQDVAVHLNPASVTSYFTGMQQRDISFLEVRMDVRLIRGAQLLPSLRSAVQGSMLCCAVSWHVQLHPQHSYCNASAALHDVHQVFLGRCFFCRCLHTENVTPCCAVQNIKACKEAVLEAAQLYADEHDDDKVKGPCFMNP
jgi:hypothetical protein